jgi:hypothetical protein
MVRDLRLRLSQQVHKLAHRPLALGDQFKHTQTRAIAEHPKVLRKQVGLGRGGREPERGGESHGFQ